MSTNRPETGSGLGPQPVPKRKMGTGAKVFLILAIILGVFALICCGGLVLVTGFYFAGMVSEDPAAVREATGEIVEIDIPDALAPKFCMDMKLPVVGDMMKTAVYEDASSNSELVLAEFGKMFQGQSREQLKQQIRQSLQGQGVGREEHLVDTNTFTKEIDVRGTPVRFTFTRGKSAVSGKPRLNVAGTFPGDEGPVLLIVNADEETLDEETITKMLESIR
jgi:hypothetical protein